jgi:prophage tail gpP-like protein
VNEKISVLFGQNKYENWESISVKKSIEALAGQFSLTVSDRWTPYGQSWFLHDQDLVKIKIGKDQIMTGYIDRVSPAGGGNGTTLKIEGREKTGDLVDCSATNKTGSWPAARFRQMVNDLVSPDGRNPFKISVLYKATISNDSFPFQLQSGEAISSALSRLCKAHEVLMVTTPEGNIDVINPGSERTDVTLEVGRNIQEWSADFDFKDRFSEYTVRGQAAGAGKSPWKDTAKGLKKVVTDDGVKRYRPMILIADSAATGASAEGRANWEAVTRKAKSISVHVTVSGFRQTEGGRLWKPNLVVKTKIPRAELDQDLLISEVEYSRSEGGTATRITLIPTDSYAKKPLKLSKAKKPGVTWR